MLRVSRALRDGLEVQGNIFTCSTLVGQPGAPGRIYRYLPIAAPLCLPGATGIKQLRKWTRDYHRIQEAKWIKESPLSPNVISEKFCRSVRNNHRISLGGAFAEALKRCGQDVWWVSQGGGKIIRDGVPQISLQEFSELEDLKDFFVVTDKKSIIEDRSEAEATLTTDRLIFEGYLQHSGAEYLPFQARPEGEAVGYATICTKKFDPVLDLSEYFSICLKLRTDGRPYFFTMETYYSNQPIMYQGIIRLPPPPTDDHWDILEIPLHHFIPMFNGSFIAHTPNLNICHVHSFGLAAVGMQGAFRCEVQWIRAFRDDYRYDIQDPTDEPIQVLDTLGMSYDELRSFYKMQHAMWHPRQESLDAEEEAEWDHEFDEVVPFHSRNTYFNTEQPYEPYDPYDPPMAKQPRDFTSTCRPPPDVPRNPGMTHRAHLSGQEWAKELPRIKSRYDRLLHLDRDEIIRDRPILPQFRKQARLADRVAVREKDKIEYRASVVGRKSAFKSTFTFLAPMNYKEWH